MEEMKRVPFPTFGNWDYYNEMPITQYFDSAMQANVDLFKPTYHYHHHNQRKVKKIGGEKNHNQCQVKKQGKVYDLTTQSPIKPKKVSKAVDEDLYKIPPDLLYQKPKRKRLLRNLWSVVRMPRPQPCCLSFNYLREKHHYRACCMFVLLILHYALSFALSSQC